MDDAGMDPLDLRRTTWRTAISGRVETFAATIADQTVFDKFFGVRYVEKLTDNINRIGKTELVVGLVFVVLMASLFVAQDSKNTEFQFLGYSFKNIAQHKEILLLVAAVLSPIAAVLSAYRRYLVEIRSECLKKIVPDPTVRSFYQQLYVRDYFDAIIRDRGRTAPRGLTVFLSVALAVFLVVLGIALLVASFSLQVTVFYDVATRPASSKIVNLFIISVSLAAILLSWVISLMQLPLPEINAAYYRKLDELKTTDPAKYDQAMRVALADSERKGRMLYFVGSLMAFMLVYAGTAVFYYPNKLDALGSFIVRALFGSLIVVLGANAATSKVRKLCYRWLFRRYPGESDERLRKFMQIGRATTILRAVAVMLMSVVYSLAALNP
jgi:hypothetical protein